jgi:hypothetical protein
MKNLIFTGLLFLFVQNSFAQNPTLNHEKYWSYRARLRNEFMKMGIGPIGNTQENGYSIPASEIFSDYQNGKVKRISWADGTSRLGYYLGVLATEYKLLSQNGQSTSKVLEELYYAMKAYERLDVNANHFTTFQNGNCGSASNTDGFFLRDDVSENFAEQWINGQSNRFYVASDRIAAQNNHPNLTCGKDLIHHNSPSQDQMFCLFLGFSLIVKSIPNSVSYNNFNFSFKAKQFTNSIITYFINNNNLGNRWRIYYPYTNQGPQDKTQFGDLFSSQYRAGLAASASAIKNEAWSQNHSNLASHMGHIGDYNIGLDEWFTSGPQSSLLPSMNYPGILNDYSFGDFWQACNYPWGSAIYNDNWHRDWNNTTQDGSHDYENAMISTGAAISKSWYIGFVPTKRVLFSLDWVPCSSINTCYHNACVFGFCNQVAYPCIHVWQCQQTISANVWCYEKSGLFSILTALAGLALDIENKAGINASGVAKISLKLISKIQAIGGIMPNLCAPFQLPTIGINTSGYALSKYSSMYKNELFPLLNRYLYGSSQHQVYDLDYNHFVNVLNEAPCKGPHIHPINNSVDSFPFIQQTESGINNWSSSNRWQTPRLRPNNNGVFSGLDYMLFYNLFMLNIDYSNTGAPSSQLVVGNYKDLMDAEVVQNNYSGSGRIYAFEHLKLSNIGINPTSSNSIHGGLSVRLGENTSIRTISPQHRIYSNFDFKCANNNFSKQTQDSINLNQAIEKAKSKDDQMAVDFLNDLNIQLDSLLKSLEKIKEYHENKERLASSNKVSRNENSFASDIALYPLPCKNILNINYKNKYIKLSEIIIHNSVGSIVKSLSANDFVEKNGNVEINLSDIPDGYYILSLTDLTNVTRKTSFVKQ